MEETLHPLRRLYRRHLVRFAWARKLKALALWAWFGTKHARHVINWKLRRLLNGVASYLGERLQWRSFETARKKNWDERGGFRMVALKEYLETTKARAHLLAEAQTVALAMPEVYPEDFRGRLHAGSWSMAIPAVHAIEVHHAEIMGGSDFVFTQSLCLHHGFYQFERDLPAEEMHGMVRINAKHARVFRYACNDDEVTSLPAAISLIGSASANYVHWLTETAPKLALIDEIDCLKDYPLIIDAGLHPNILESLNCLNTYAREIVQLERRRICKVEKLISITPVAYAPFDYRRGVDPERLRIDPSWAMYVPRGLHALREKLLSRLGSDGPSRGRRLYLRRNSRFRTMRNAAEVEALLDELGFQVIEPETLSFAEQVRLFSAAESIVAQAGAALGNMIFAPQGCRVIILSAWSPWNIYYYFSNIASILGQKCILVLCVPDRQDDVHPAHTNLMVDIQALREALGQ